MEVPAAVTGEKPNIFVGLSTKYEKQAKYFHCSVCGKVAFGYYSDIKMVVAGNTEVEKPILQVQCHGAIDVMKDRKLITTRCKAVYVIG